MLQIPKPGGIRKGWSRQFVVVCDFKLFLYDTMPERANHAASNIVGQVIDMRWAPFSSGFHMYSLILLFVTCSCKRRLLSKIFSFVHFSLQLTNNNFCLKCWKNYCSIFMNSRDMNFVMLSCSEVQFQEKCMQSLLIQIEILSNVCAFNLEFMGITVANRPNETIFSKLNT